MVDRNREEMLIEKLDPKRRNFLKTVLAAGFSAPLVVGFTIDSLAAASANAASGPNSAPNSGPNTAPATCRMDVGYVGPGSFQSHLVDTEVNTSIFSSPPQVNGEASIAIQGGTFAAGVIVTLTLIGGAIVSKAYIDTLGVQIPFTSGALITPANVGKLCSIDALLNAMASGLAQIVVTGSFSASPFTLVGVVTSGTVASMVSLQA